MKMWGEDEQMCFVPLNVLLMGSGLGASSIDFVAWELVSFILGESC